MYYCEDNEYDDDFPSSLVLVVPTGFNQVASVGLALVKEHPAETGLASNRIKRKNRREINMIII
jgi:hypothetical protein